MTVNHSRRAERRRLLLARKLKQTIEDIHARNAGVDPDEIQRIVDEAVAEVRAKRHANKQAAKAAGKRRPAPKKILKRSRSTKRSASRLNE